MYMYIYFLCVYVYVFVYGYVYAYVFVYVYVYVSVSVYVYVKSVSSMRCAATLAGPVPRGTLLGFRGNPPRPGPPGLTRGLLRAQRSRATQRQTKAMQREKCVLWRTAGEPSKAKQSNAMQCKTM